MRARVYSNGGNSTGGFTFNGGTLIGTLILAGNPSEPLEAASKQYLDSSLVNLNASNISSGILPSGRLPTFVGDLVKPAGSSTINLAPIGVVAGDYIKPTVDAKGRVTGGSSLVEADIPNISWDKVSLNRPTTLSGYGINNAIPLSGGTLTGFLSFNGSVTGSLQAVTKQYIDVTLSSASGIAIGDIIRKPYSTTPPGFFKCNGAEVDKTTYNSLYATIGDRFSKQINAGSGQPWSQQYVINEIQNNDINNWITGTALPAPLYSVKSIVTKNRVYLIGGANSTVGSVSTVYTAPINSDGTLGNWVAGTSLPGVMAHSSIIITKNRVYLLGGWNTNAVYTASVNSDGTLGTWTTGTALPGIFDDSSVIVTKNRVYLLGGRHGNGGVWYNIVYTSVISSDGTLGSWIIGTSLPGILASSQAIVTNNRVYLVGGAIAGTTSVSTVYTAPINPDGTLGSWTIGTSLPGPLQGSQAIVTKNRVYLLGGYINGNVVSTVYTAPINSDGTLGVWTTGTTLPSALQLSSVIITKNRIYLLGGYTTQAISTVYTASISGGLNDYSAYYSSDVTNYMMPGSGRPWQQQYQINETQTSDITGWNSNSSVLPTGVSLSQIVVTKNRVYVLGGYGTIPTSIVYTATINSDGTLGVWSTDTSLPVTLSHSCSIVTKNRIYLFGGLSVSNSISTVYTAPINADGTLGTWTTSTALPVNLSHSKALITKNRVYLLGGISNGIITSTIYTAPINADGTLGTWVNSGTLPVGTFENEAFITKNRVYIVGGHTGWTSPVVSTIYTATINSDGIIGPWTTATPLPIAFGSSSAFITKNRVYLFGGHNGTSVISTVYVASINSDGTLGTWVVSNSLPGALCQSKCICVKNRVYLIGGFNGTNDSTIIYSASILEGKNDYSSYYDGTITSATLIDNSTTFALPDLTQSEKFDTVSYIKY